MKKPLKKISGFSGFHKRPILLNAGRLFSRTGNNSVAAIKPFMVTKGNSTRVNTVSANV